MQMHQEHFVAVQNAMLLLDTPERRVMYKSGKFPNSHRVVDLNMFYRWDLWFVAMDRILSKQFHNELYAYTDDDLIYEDLKEIIPDL